MQEIRASAQFHDYTGDAVADQNDNIASISSYLNDRGLIGREEDVIAIDFYAGTEDRFMVNAIVVAAKGKDDISAWLNDKADPLPARKVSMDVSIEEFFSLFKRFNIVIAPKGLDVLGRHIQD